MSVNGSSRLTHTRSVDSESQERVVLIVRCVIVHLDLMYDKLAVIIAPPGPSALQRVQTVHQIKYQIRYRQRRLQTSKSR
jgi:hypothetical protein